MKTLTVAAALTLASAAAAETRILAESNHGHPFGLNPATGQMRPTTFGGIGGLNSGYNPALVASGTTLYVGSHDGHVTRFDGHTWNAEASAWFSATYFADMTLAGDVLVAGIGDGRVLTLDAATLALHKERAAPFPVQAVAVVGGFVYAGSLDGGVARAGLGDGAFAPLWRLLAPVSAMAADGVTLLIACDNGQLYRYEPGPGTMTHVQWIPAQARSLIVDESEVVVSGDDAFGPGSNITRYTRADLSWLSNASTPIPVNEMVVAPLLACGPDMNRDGGLSIADFAAFQNAFVEGSVLANFNFDWTLNIADFAAFQSAYVAGCP